MAVILTVIKHHCELETPIWVHENVLAFDEKILQDHCSAKWDIIKIKIRPEDPACIYILYSRKPQSEVLLIHYAWTSLCHLFLKMPQGTSQKAQGTRAPRHRAQDTGHRAQGTGHKEQGTRAQGTRHGAPGHLGTGAQGTRAQGTRAQGTRAQGTREPGEQRKTQQRE